MDNTKDVAEMKPKTIVNGSSFMEPKNLAEAMQLAQELAKSEIVPKEFIGKPANILIAVGMGQSVGLSWMQSLQSIAVINGKPTMYGDSVLGIVKASGVEEYTEENYNAETKTATCTTKRKDDPVVVTRSFSIEDAKKAGLASKPGPWQQYPLRMLQLRARSWALRDKYPDLLKGLQVREEVEDFSVETSAVEEPVLRKSEISANLGGPAAANAIRTDVISDAERKDLMELAVGNNIPPAAIKEMLKEKYGIDSSAMLPKDKLDDVKAWIAKG